MSVCFYTNWLLKDEFSKDIKNILFIMISMISKEITRKKKGKNKIKYLINSEITAKI